MRDIRTMNMAEGQKIESDDVMKRIGDLAYRNMGSIAKSFLFDSGKALIVGGGLLVEPSSGMTVNIPSGSVFQRFIDVIPCLQTTPQTVAIDAASGSPRVDIIEAQIKSITDKDDFSQVGTVSGGVAIAITNELVKRDIKYYLSARKQTSTTTPTAATAGTLTGTVAIATTIDLSNEYLLNLADGEDGSYQEIDCRGATPSATTRNEIITAINNATGRTMAATGVGNVIELIGEGTGQTSYFAIKPPYTDTDKDCLEIVFGVSIGGIYKYSYSGDNEWFKLAEIDVGAATATITSDLIRNVNQKKTWASGASDVLLNDVLISDNFNVQNGVFKINGYLSGNVIKWTSAQEVGTSINISTIENPVLAALNDTDVAFIDETQEDLRTYRFNGTWTQVGNDLNISGITYPSITALSSSRIAFVDSTIEEIRTYDFDGTDWTLTGSGLSISSIGIPSITALSNSRIAFIDNSIHELKTYDFDGSNWSLVGTGLDIGSISAPSITAFSNSEIVFIEGTERKFKIYSFDGNSWSLSSTASSSISGISQPVITALNLSDIAFLDLSEELLKVYRFNGIDWIQVGIGLDISTIGNLALTALNGTDVAFIDETQEDLRLYRFSFSISGNSWGVNHPDF